MFLTETLIIKSCVSCVQALDGAFNQENREKCRAATGPLIEAVDNLTAFASNPEFASIPAQISPEVRVHLHTVGDWLCDLKPVRVCYYLV